MARSTNEPLPGPPDPWVASSIPSFRSRPPYLMTEMIAAEPALAERLIHRLAKDEALDALTGAVRDTAASGAPILATGCGTSEHAATGIGLLLSEALALPAGRDVRAVPALEALRRPLRDGLLVAVSHEGGTRATNDALAAAREAGARTALITVGGGSPGAAIADIVVRTEEQDRSWCHTVGYLSPLVVGAVLAGRLTRTRPDAQAIRALLDVTNDARTAASVAAGLPGVDRGITVGAGVDHVSARELALKIAEGARLPAAAHELETILHGHLAAANRWTGIVLVLTAAAASEPIVLERARRVLTAAGTLSMPTAAILADTLAGQVPEAATSAGRIVLPHTGRVDATAGSLLGTAVALQLLTERLARARGVDPDTLGREDPAQAAAHG